MTINKIINSGQHLNFYSCIGNGIVKNNLMFVFSNSFGNFSHTKVWGCKSVRDILS